MNEVPKCQLQQGFALFGTMALLLLLALVTSELLELSTVHLRTEGRGSEMTVARANARLGLMIAIGDLQKHTGPDQRISPPPSILDTDPESLGIDGITAPSWGVICSTTGSAGMSALPIITSPAEDGQFLGKCIYYVVEKTANQITS